MGSPLSAIRHLKWKLKKFGHRRASKGKDCHPMNHSLPRFEGKIEQGNAAEM
jgi:hypothetical protein